MSALVGGPGEREPSARADRRSTLQQASAQKAEETPTILDAPSETESRLPWWAGLEPYAPRPRTRNAQRSRMRNAQRATRNAQRAQRLTRNAQRSRTRNAQRATRNVYMFSVPDRKHPRNHAQALASSRGATTGFDVSPTARAIAARGRRRHYMIPGRSFL